MPSSGGHDEQGQAGGVIGNSVGLMSELNPMNVKPRWVMTGSRLWADPGPRPRRGPRRRICRRIWGPWFLAQSWGSGSWVCRRRRPLRQRGRQPPGGAQSQDSGCTSGLAKSLVFAYCGHESATEVNDEATILRCADKTHEVGRKPNAGRTQPTKASKPAKWPFRPWGGLLGTPLSSRNLQRGTPDRTCGRVASLPVLCSSRDVAQQDSFGPGAHA
jgi:hypothetical protein